MAELLLLHHSQGLTEGVRAFADDLRAAGHVVHVPDLFEGKTFGTLADGMAHVEQLGFGTILERGAAAAAGLPDRIVYAGMSLGVLPAQMLAQARRGAGGALLLHGCVPPSEFGAWPDGVPVQIHLMDRDPVAAEDLAAARAFEGAELFVYRGDRHLFSDRSLPDHDEPAAALLHERVLAFLAASG